MIEQNYRIDMIPDGAPVVVHISQYDTTARRLSFELYNGGIAYELPTGAVASMAGTKPDGNAFLYAMTVVGNVASIDVQQQMALVAGDVEAEIQITGSDGKIGSANFVLRVERGPIDEDSVISETDLPIFEELVSDAQAAAADAQTAADTASTAAESISAILPASAGTSGQVLTKKANGADWENLQWGQMTGALTDQTDLASALDAKADKTMLAPVESSSTASRAYSVGSYLVYNGILYRVTAAISSGQTLTPGTNITATNAGAELASLNNDLEPQRATVTVTDMNVGVNQLDKSAGVAVLTLSITPTSNYSAYESGRIVVPAGYRPRSSRNSYTVTKVGSSTQSIQWQVLDNGSVRAGVAIPENTNVQVTIVYII